MAQDKLTEMNRLALDFKRLQSFSEELKDMAREIARLQEYFGLKERGFFTSDEHDKIELLLFRYLLCRDSLWDFVNYYQNYADLFSASESQAKGFLIGFSAAQHLAFYSSTLVATFVDEPKVIAKLNEAYYRSDIPKNTYNKLFENITSVKNLKALRAAAQIFSEEFNNPNSAVSKVAAANFEYRSLVLHAKQLMLDADNQISDVLKKTAILLPDVRNQLRHTVIMSYVKKLREGVGDNLYILRGLLFTNVSRLKSPISSSVTFGSDQIKQIKSMLEPGDVILTYKDGYMSNIFLPGVFKHGITYVGSPEQRRACGLTQDVTEKIPKSKQRKLLHDFAFERLASGHEADLIEAVAEGVIFSSLERLLEEPITRFVVLRPRLNRNERVKNLLTVFLLLGSSYDFKFDFNEATYQCCTEVIYRALNNLGPIQFTLTKRLGLPTLSADDIIHYYLTSNSESFEFILLIGDNSESSSNHAIFFTGLDGKQRLESLMIR